MRRVRVLRRLKNIKSKVSTIANCVEKKSRGNAFKLTHFLPPSLHQSICNDEWQKEGKKGSKKLPKNRSTGRRWKNIFTVPQKMKEFNFKIMAFNYFSFSPRSVYTLKGLACGER